MHHVSECTVRPIEGKVPHCDLANVREHVFAFAGLGCQGCLNRVRNALLRVPGVVRVEIDLLAAVGRIWCRADSAPPQSDLLDAVVGASHGTHHRYLAVPLRRRFADHDSHGHQSSNGRK
ncbi:MAG: heavy-metal-associated domain-containing protein [Gemmatimonadetes bacterium]|nr:heavy-metal-associated domain-containing protein [Gemmatimonadota bacterium]